MESFPPEAPIAIVSPLSNRLLVQMVWWTSDSKALKKHSLQMAWPVLGRFKTAEFVEQVQHRIGIA